MFAHEFIRNAYLAGTFVALACGFVGWFAVLRGQVFAGDALGHMAFVGAIAAAVIGVEVRVGLFALTLGLAAVMAGLGRRAQADDVTIGVVFSWVLGIGVLLIALLSSGSSGGDGLIVANTLFGSIFGLDAGQSFVAAAIGLAVVLAATAIARPLLFASLDGELAALHGVPVRALGLALLLLIGAVTAEGTQAIGALLVLGLIAAPAGAALRLTSRPYAGMALSAAIALAAMWGGIALSYAIPSLPPSTAIIGLAVGAYALASLVSNIAVWPLPGKLRDRGSMSEVRSP
ncbi:MAG TPA: metal ABC transporter permease [Solirubrobacteraceae bacterium]|jgi:zinc/manganese transport system permease protein|nr:metal ABC transporter permease [Solirubrobacteraceae bacterium]